MRLPFIMVDDPFCEFFTFKMYEHFAKLAKKGTKICVETPDKGVVMQSDGHWTISGREDWDSETCSTDSDDTWCSEVERDLEFGPEEGELGDPEQTQKGDSEFNAVTNE